LLLRAREAREDAQSRTQTLEVIHMGRSG